MGTPPQTPCTPPPAGESSGPARPSNQRLQARPRAPPVGRPTGRSTARRPPVAAVGPKPTPPRAFRNTRASMPPIRKPAPRQATYTEKGRLLSCPAHAFLYTRFLAPALLAGPRARKLSPTGSWIAVISCARASAPRSGKAGMRVHAVGRSSDRPSAFPRSVKPEVVAVQTSVFSAAAAGAAVAHDVPARSRSARSISRVYSDFRLICPSRIRKSAD